MHVLIGPSTFGELDRTPLVRLSDAGCEVIDNPYKRKLTKPELIKLLSRDVVGLIAGLETLDEEVLGGSKLKVISRCGAGMSNVDMRAAERLGIKVFSTPDAPTEAVAELTLGAILSLLRMIPQMNEDLHDGVWKKKIGMQLEGKTVVVIGFGRIGQRLAEFLKPFNANIIAVDPYLKGSIKGVPLLPLECALEMADIVSIHSSGNTHIMGEKEFGHLKSGAFLLNAARGDSVDENALIRAIKEHRVRGAWIDTFGEEPYNGRLAGMREVILTPHAGSYTAECRKRMEMEAVNNLIVALKEK